MRAAAALRFDGGRPAGPGAALASLRAHVHLC